MTRRTRSKFRNVPTVVDGIRFDSKREAARYGELKLLQKLGAICNLVADKKELRQPLRVNGHLVCTYEADFMYVDKSTANIIIEDCKGFRTPIYRLKKKLMKAILGIEIVEV